jgi:hypothetical protein
MEGKSVVSPGSSNQLKVTPELAAHVVRSYLLPMFDSENQRK